MSELLDARHMLDLAEISASAGDLASADELLRSVARIQEAELGPLHTDLASTLNNLAIVNEKAGRPGEAEGFYRRALAIVSASLPADDPMVVASRQNLEDFCRARGLPVESPGTMPSSPDAAAGPVATREDAAGAARTPGGGHTADADLTAGAASPLPVTPSPVLRTPGPMASQPSPTATRRASRPLLWAAIGVFVLLAAVFLSRRPDSSSATQPAQPPEATASPATPQPAEPAPSAPAERPATPAPIEQGPPPVAVPKSTDRGVPSDPSAAAATPSRPVVLATVQLCQTFSTSGGTWRCDPAGDSVAPGRIVLLTRVRSEQDATVVHRWFHGDTLRQAVRLTVRANPTAGYRTYSRQTVVGDSEWRVEVRSADGTLLHEQRFAVR